MYERLSFFVNNANRRVSVAFAVVITTLLTIALLATRQILFFDNTWQTIIFILTEFMARIKKLVLRNQQMLEDEVGIASELNENNLKEDMELVMEELRKNR